MKKKVFIILITFVLLLIVWLLFCLFKQNDSSDEDPTLIESTYIVNDFEYASINIDTGTVMPNSVNVTFEYTGNYEANTGEWFTLEQEINGKWYQIPKETIGGVNISFSLESYPIERDQALTKEYKWNMGYPSLSSGHYRIIVAIDERSIQREYTKYYLAAEFNIE